MIFLVKISRGSSLFLLVLSSLLPFFGLFGGEGSFALAATVPSTAAQPPSEGTDSLTGAVSAPSSSQSVQESPNSKKWTDYLGMTYFTFFDGPGLGEDFLSAPNYFGNARDKGWMAFTNLSVRVKLTKKIGLDYQSRFEQVLTNEWDWRYQGGRVGISGVLLEGKDWTLSGAFNSDIPGVGQQAVARTQIVNPGLFSSFNYSPSGSRWSVFGLVTPRITFYRDKLAMWPADVTGGLRPGDKQQILLMFQPGVVYSTSERGGIRLGMVIDYRKNAGDSGLRRWVWPIDLGFLYKLNKSFNLYPHVRFSTPLDNSIREQIASARGKFAAPWTHTFSVGMWIYGTLF